MTVLCCSTYPLVKIWLFLHVNQPIAPRLSFQLAVVVKPHVRSQLSSTELNLFVPVSLQSLSAPHLFFLSAPWKLEVSFDV